MVVVVSEGVSDGALETRPEFWLGWKANDADALSAGCSGAEQSSGLVKFFLCGGDGSEDVEAFGDIQGKPFGLEAPERIVRVLLSVAGFARG